MPSETIVPEAVSVRYAREQYALGYFQGRTNAEPGGGAGLDFARFYAEWCAREDRPMDVQEAYRRWLADRAEWVAELRYERALEHATNYD
ncbi:hypothetical protein EV191_10733 [Tamaricihabitans halophyticus]|uniref:Uncharacterized protein n=1 Tax=Tamaricihabitans halophyticus TaxID=1262583 RepID=A0A4R2QMH9_9PSEU|nr:hypothetical protein [Tamaricihabitans halophyticus]TCP50773.1 hypothetical protein EV191_10733 [Tamaricihabitans halophyticus]